MRKTRSRPRKPREPQFYEAIPTAVEPFSVTLPEQLRLTFDTMGEVATVAQASASTRAKSWLNRAAMLALQSWQYIKTASSQLRMSANLAIDNVLEYTPVIAADAVAYTGRARRKLTTRNARTAYISIIAVGIIGVSTFGFISASRTLQAYAQDISTPAALMAKKRTGITITDRNGEILFQGYGAGPSQPIKLSTMPKALKDATLVAEDPSFYDHPGVSWRGTLRAAVTDLKHQQTVEGGSTLTQQLVKNALLTSDKRFERKYQEMLLAMELERHYSKDEILEMYLNETYYGQGASGVEAASQVYFHKPAANLSLSESALMAGLPLGPSRFDPNVDLEAAIGRRDYVINRLAEFGKITPAQAAAAKQTPVVLAGTPADPATATIVYAKQVQIQAPHFVFYVLDRLAEVYGEDAIQNDGMTVRTTLDLAKQNLGQQTVARRVGELGGHHVTNGGLVSLEPSTGDILAMVGSIDYNTPGFGAVNVTVAQLQPGSSFKPIAYATAFKKGWNGATHVDDVPMSVPSGDGTMYTPQNYDLKFRGSVSLRSALANSLNIPAIKVLQHATIADTVKTAHDLGITGLQDPSRLGLSMVLGSGEVRPIDMATVYATFANGGTRVDPRSILQVQDRYGKDITKSTQPPAKQVLDPRIAFMITSILSDNTARTPEFGAFSPLRLSRPAAAKTGTTNDFRDNWTVGYTPQLATAVWVGNNDHTAMFGVDGITGAAPIWHDYMEGALQNQPIVNFATPSGITMVGVCADGGIANPWDQVSSEAFLSEALPTKRCASAPPRPNPTPTETTPSPLDATTLRDTILERLRQSNSGSGPGRF